MTWQLDNIQAVNGCYRTEILRSWRITKWNTVIKRKRLL